MILLRLLAPARNCHDQGTYSLFLRACTADFGKIRFKGPRGGRSAAPKDNCAIGQYVSAGKGKGAIPIMVEEITIAAIPPPIYIIQGVIATKCASCAHCTIQKDGQDLI